MYTEYFIKGAMSISGALIICVKKDFLAIRQSSKNGIVEPKGV